MYRNAVPHCARRAPASGANWAVTALVLLLTGACTKTPDPPEVTTGPIETVNGSERLGWQQTAANSAEIATFHYAVYLDNIRSEPAGATCVPPASRTSAAFSCSLSRPTLGAGPHTIELATFIVDGIGAVFESSRSSTLRVNKTTSTASVTPAAVPPVTWSTGLTFSTADGLRLRIDRLASSVVRPVDIAFVPDGRLFVAEESGRIVVLMPDGRLLAEAMLPLARSRAGNARLLSFTADPEFDKTHLVYAVYTTATENGSRTFNLSRFSESSNALFGEIVLLDRVAASTASASSVRIGADGSFAAFDDGGDLRSAGDLASPAGRCCASTQTGDSADQAGLSPAYATEFHSPRGFDWQPGARVLWITDRLSDNSASRIGVGSAPGAQRRGVRLASYALPPETRPSSVAFLRGSAVSELRNDLLIASEEGRHLLRVRFDAGGGTRVAATERLLQDVVGGVRVVAVSPGGGLYIGTEDAVAQISLADEAGVRTMIREKSTLA